MNPSQLVGTEVAETFYTEVSPLIAGYFPDALTAEPGGTRRFNDRRADVKRAAISLTVDCMWTSGSMMWGRCCFDFS